MSTSWEGGDTMSEITLDTVLEMIKANQLTAMEAERLLNSYSRMKSGTPTGLSDPKNR